MEILAYNSRYPKNKDWKQIRSKILTLCPYCAYPNCKNLAKQIHHVVYIDHENRPLNYITVRDVPWLLGRYLYPLCEYHHGADKPDQIHHPSNWNKGVLAPPTWDSHQKYSVVLKLQKEFSKKYPQIVAQLKKVR